MLCLIIFKMKIIDNKKVLLRERKRHTARRVVSTPSVVLPGYSPLGGGPGTPPGGVPGQVPPRGVTRSGTPPGGSGYPPGGYPVRYPPGGPGTPPGGVPGQVPPRGGPGTPPLPHGILGNVAKHYGIWVPPPGVDRETK